MSNPLHSLLASSSPTSINVIIRFAWCSVSSTSSTRLLTLNNVQSMTAFFGKDHHTKCHSGVPLSSRRTTLQLGTDNYRLEYKNGGCQYLCNGEACHPHTAGSLRERWHSLESARAQASADGSQRSPDSPWPSSSLPCAGPTTSLSHSPSAPQSAPHSRYLDFPFCTSNLNRCFTSYQRTDLMLP